MGGTHNSIFKPCTFMYNGNEYGGIDIYIDPAQVTLIEFNGATNFEIFGVDYLDTLNNIAMNEEIASSIKYDTVINNIYDTGALIRFNEHNIATDKQAPWINAVSQNGWVHHTNKVSFYKDAMGIVRLRGLIKNGTTATGTVLFSLPNGYRPSMQMYFSSYTNANSNPESQPITIEPNGNIRLIDKPSLTFVGLDGISFRPD